MPDELSHVWSQIADLERRSPIDLARWTAEQSEYARLQHLYPNQFVAVRDTWDGRTLTRAVIDADANSAALCDRLEELPEGERSDLDVLYVEA